MIHTTLNTGDSNSNLIESVHADVNREGVRCTLLGGVKKGEDFDAMKMRTLEVHTALFNHLDPFLTSISHYDTTRHSKKQATDLHISRGICPKMPQRVLNANV
jgi:hypothetical protein